jgi:hypothetical protein
MHRFQHTISRTIVGLILLGGLAAPTYAQDTCLREVLPQTTAVYAVLTKPLTLAYEIPKGQKLGLLTEAKLNDQQTALAEDTDLILPLDNPKGSLTIKKPTEVQKKTGEGYWLLEGTTVQYELPTASYKVTIPKGTTLICDPSQGYALNQASAAIIAPPENFQVTLKVAPQTMVARIPGASGTGTTLQFQPSQAPVGEYVTLVVAKNDFDFTKVQFHVCLRQPGENKPFVPSADVELKEVQIGKAKLRARIPPIPGISGVHRAVPVDLLVMARGPDDKLAEVLSKEFEISSRTLAVYCWLAAFLFPWFLAALITRFKGPEKTWRFNPIWYVSGKDGGASLSLAQILLWTILVFSASFYVLVASGKLLDLTNDVLILLGIASGTSVIAKITASAKDEKGLMIAAPAPKLPKWLDLIQTEGQADLYKFQMALFTLLAAVFVAGKIYTTLEFPGLPEGLLTLIGISNGVYLTAKGATKTTYEKLGGKSDELGKRQAELQQCETEEKKAAAELEKAKIAKNAAHQELQAIQQLTFTELDSAGQAELKKQVVEKQAILTTAENYWREAEQKLKDAEIARNLAQSRVNQLQKEVEDLKKIITG